MKKLIALFSACLSLSASAYQIQANCRVRAGRDAVCTICNNFYAGIASCNLRAAGQLRSGFILSTWNSTNLGPGQCMNVFVYANNPYIDPMVYAEGGANCQLLRPW